MLQFEVDQKHQVSHKNGDAWSSLSSIAYYDNKLFYENYKLYFEIL